MPIERLIFGSIDGMVHKRGRTMYGLQDAGSAFDRTSGSVPKNWLQAWHFGTHCVLTRGNLVAQRYGDDYPVLGTRHEMRESREDLSKHFLLQSRGVSGPRPSAGDIGEIRCLGRTVCWLDKWQFPNDDGVERIELEADARHAQILVSTVNLSEQSKSVCTSSIPKHLRVQTAVQEKRITIHKALPTEKQQTSAPSIWRRQ